MKQQKVAKSAAAAEKKLLVSLWPQDRAPECSMCREVTVGTQLTLWKTLYSSQCNLKVYG